jgi:hypothetical protein
VQGFGDSQKSDSAAAATDRDKLAGKMNPEQVEKALRLLAASFPD